MTEKLKVVWGIIAFSLGEKTVWVGLCTLGPRSTGSRQTKVPKTVTNRFCQKTTQLSVITPINKHVLSGRRVLPVPFGSPMLCVCVQDQHEEAVDLLIIRHVAPECVWINRDWIWGWLVQIVAMSKVCLGAVSIHVSVISYLCELHKCSLVQISVYCLACTYIIAY